MHKGLFSIVVTVLGREISVKLLQDEKASFSSGHAIGHAHNFKLVHPVNA